MNKTNKSQMWLMKYLALLMILAWLQTQTHRLLKRHFKCKKITNSKTLELVINSTNKIEINIMKISLILQILISNKNKDKILIYKVIIISTKMINKKNITLLIITTINNKTSKKNNVKSKIIRIKNKWYKITYKQIKKIKGIKIGNKT